MNVRSGLILLLLVVVLAVVYFKTSKPPITAPPSNTCAALRAEMESQSCPDTVAYDWADLVRYREENLRLPAPAAGERRVVFFGDSITSEWPGLDSAKRIEGTTVVNRGIPGQLTEQMLLRFRQDVIDLHPKAVVILGGINDLARVLPPTIPTIESNLASMAQLAQANGIRVVLASVLPVSDYELNPVGKPYLQTRMHSPLQIRELNDWIRKYAAESHCIFVDYYSELADNEGFLKRGYSRDGLHPNAKGYEVMEPLVVEAMKTAGR